MSDEQEHPCQGGSKRHPCKRTGVAYYVAANEHPLLANLLGLYLCPVHAEPWLDPKHVQAIRVD